ncbi:lytic transglycosylase [Mesorhizobium sp. Root157]|uniref:lytic transglycosylase domain-containing protein n=1 Tax=Mesorhizobium sp. Root157 TaxID=1736477 RepID=UPI0006F76673|nr:transglycosylase SLT domain-containing protein [Mesorhizobium sp. Root157]KQZ81364.1 lytic transglycosylase [Mesorhizobium sp. Root157]
MNKLSVLTVAFAAGVLSIAASTAQAAQIELPGVKSYAASNGQSAEKQPATQKSAGKSLKTAAANAGKPTKKKPRAVSKSTSKSTGGTRYTTIIARYAASYGVPVHLAHAVVQVESNYRANVVGSAGEIGLMQIKPATARMMGYSGSTKGLFNPETNIKYGMKYLAMAHDLGGGTTCGTILKYNAGHAAKRMNPVSSAYCSKVKVQMAALGSST